MDIGWPTNVRHIAHVTFDRLNGFLGLPVELELEVPRRVPSASVSVFGVSAESMQCSFDGRGNSVPTILLLLQERLYDQGGLQAEGIFRINAENSCEEHVREQLNKGMVPYDVDVHCLAGLIKAWFRELPRGVLDSLNHEEVMQCHTEEQCLALVRMLPPAESALLNWAINLMADVAQEEHSNKMNARNIAMVFAPNMTQVSDPLTALMHAVQVMNLLKTLILRTIKDREKSTFVSTSRRDPQEGDKGDLVTQAHSTILSSSEIRIKSHPVEDDELILETENGIHEKLDDPDSLKESKNKNEVLFDSQESSSTCTLGNVENSNTSCQMADATSRNGSSINKRKLNGFGKKMFFSSKDDTKMVEQTEHPNGIVEAWENVDSSSSSTCEKSRDNGWAHVQDVGPQMLKPKLESKVMIRTTIGNELKRIQKQVKRQLHYHMPQPLDDRQQSNPSLKGEEIIRI